MALIHDVVSDLTAASVELDDLVAGLDVEEWARSTPAPGWTIAHQIAHLADTDRAAALAATDPAGFAEVLVEAMTNLDGFVDEAAAQGAQQAPSRILDEWRNARNNLAQALFEVPDGVKIPWFGPPMSATSMATARLMETWAHGLDIADALGVQMPQTDRIKAVVHIGVRTRDFAYVVNGKTPPAEPFRFELVAPSGARWTWGPPEATDLVRGPAVDFCELVTQRRNLADLNLEITGADARAWSQIAQCFAGPAGVGREPTAPGDAPR